MSDAVSPRGPACSVVVPTTGESEQLRRTLEALSSQSIRPDDVQVIVVDNSQHDAAARYVVAATDALSVQLVRQPVPGAAAARNAGLAAATGEVVVFVDDDIVVSPGFLAAHLQAHDDVSRIVGVGPIVERTVSGGWFLRYLAERGAINRIDDPGRLSHLNVYGANASVRRDALLEVGGFDERFRRREDAELGVRLIQRGVAPVLVDDAVGEHHSAVGPTAYVRRSYWNGYYVAMLIEKHPDMARFERMELYRPWVRYASYLAGPVLCVLGAILAPFDRTILHGGFTALVLARSSSGFAAYRRGR